MNDKIKLLEAAMKKISSEKEFMAFVLSKYLEIEKISEGSLISELKCSLEDYYKLGLCRVPKTTSKDFILRLNSMCEYTHTPVSELNKIIKRVDTIIKLSENANSSSLLMAARDKKKNEKKD